MRRAYNSKGGFSMQLAFNRGAAFRITIALVMVFVMLFALARPAHAVVGVTSILIPSVIAALESWGISTAADGLDGAEIATWFHDKLTSWETAAQISLANIVTGIKMTPIGQVLLNPIALAGIREFGAWLVQQEGLVAGGPDVPVIQAGTTFNGYPVWASGYVESARYRTSFVCHGCWAIVNADTNSSYIYFVSVTSSAYVTLTEYSKSSGTETVRDTSVDSWHSLNGGYWDRYSLTRQAFVGSDPSPVSYSYTDVLAASGGVQSGDGSLSLDPSSEMAVPSASDIQDKEMLINTSLDVGADAAAWYEQVMNKVAANDMTATGVLVGAGTITADQVLDQGAIREEDGAIVWPDVVQPIGVVGLDDIFPFCIPFDIYHFCQALSATPTAPVFDIPFVVDGLVDYTFHLDFSDFDTVAQILRTMELLLFCVGLAFVTRSMFIRG